MHPLAGMPSGCRTGPGLEAKTIHRLLETDPRTGEFRRTEGHPLDCDLLVVDEASMVDVLLMRSLLRAVPDASALLIVGDVDELGGALPELAHQPSGQRRGHRACGARQQQGMASRWFEPGPLSETEVCLRGFARRLRALIPKARLRRPPADWSA